MTRESNSNSSDSHTGKKNALLGEALAIIMDSEDLETREWDSLSLVVDFSEGRQREYGYTYHGDLYNGFTSDSNYLIIKMYELRQYMIDNGDRAWHQSLIQIAKPDYNLSVVFEFDDPTRWSRVITSLDMSDYANSLRPEL